MEGIVKKYKSDLIAISIICLVILIFFGVSYLKWLHPIEDCGREFYVPLQILEGRILYKDIYSFYGPFAPYVLALLFKIFGATLTTGYYIGFFVNFLLCGVIYYLSRLLLSAYQSCLVTLSFVIAVFFIPSLGGYQGTIVPYSYNALFGLCFILFQVAFLSKSFISKESSNTPLLLSALFASLAITCKQDYALSSLLITLFYTLYLFYNKYKVLDLFKYWFVTLILPIGAYGFFLLYVPFNIYLNKSLFPITIATNEFTQNQIVSFFSIKHTLFSLQFFASSALMYLSVALLLLILFYLFYKVRSTMFFKKMYDKYKLLSWVIIISIAYLILSEIINIFLVKLPLIINSLVYIRFISWCPLFITLTLFIYLYNHWFKKNNITEKDRIFYFIAIAGLLVSIRAYSYCFNGYLIFPLYIAFIYILLEKIPSLFKKIDVQIVKASFSASFIVFLILFASGHCFIYSNMNHLVQTKYGSFKTFAHVAVGFNQVIDYINNNIKKNAIVTCYPEETMLNFLTRHLSTVMPTEYQYSGPDKSFLKKLGKSDYIIISNYTYIKDTPGFLELLSNGNNGWYEWLTSHYTVVSVLGGYGSKQKHPVQEYGSLVFKKNK